MTAFLKVHRIEQRFSLKFSLIEIFFLILLCKLRVCAYFLLSHNYGYLLITIVSINRDNVYLYSTNFNKEKTVSDVCLMFDISYMN